MPQTDRRQFRKGRRHCTAAVRCSYVCLAGLTVVGKESRSVCKAAERQSCESRVNPQDCLKTAEKKSQTFLRLTRYARLSCECLTLSVRSSCVHRAFIVLFGSEGGINARVGTIRHTFTISKCYYPLRTRGVSGDLRS